MAKSDAPKFRTRAYHGTEPFCFVSYSHDDSSVVFDQIKALNDAGYRVYYDEGIHPGHTWRDELAHAIENCGVFLLFATHNSINSANCLRELNFALDRDKPVVAIHLEEVEMSPGMQLALGDRQAIIRDRFEDDQFQARVNSSVGEYISRRDLSRDSANTNPGTSQTSIGASSRRARTAMVSLGIVVLLGGLGFYWIEQREQTQQDYVSTLARVDALIERDRFADAYVLMQQLDPEDNPLRSEYFERTVVPGTLKVANDGVLVSFKPYAREDVDWFPLGVTPFTDPVAVPRGVLQLRLELEGHESREIVAANPGPLFGNDLYLTQFARGRFDQSAVRLAREGVVPPDMVEVPSANQPLFLQGWTKHVGGFDVIAETPSFFVSKFEVTNAQFREFVVAGGYAESKYWQGLEFKDGEIALTFEEAMSRFVDRSGRSGPSTWSLSNFAEGEADLPVGGVSWYEAVAYARFRGLALPTIYQWVRLALGPIEGLYPLAPAIEKASNYSNRRLLAASDRVGLGPWGTYNTAGNVREWVWNLGGDFGLIQGSSWQDYGNYSVVGTAPRIDRHPTNGIRLVHNNPQQSFDVAQLDPINLAFEDPYVNREPVSDETFNGMRYQFTVPKREPLEVVVEQVVETDLWEAWEHRLKLSDEESLTILLFKPKNVAPPYQTILYGPPGNAFQPGLSNSDAVPAQIANFDYVLRGGRAVALPIWSWTYERRREGRNALDTQDPELVGEAQRIVARSWHRDAVQTINYLETLDDYSTDELTFMGYSFGSIIGPIVVALENRISNAVFISGGLVQTNKLHPMMDTINYVPRITVPVLQLNGRYDHSFPWKESAERHFELLGTPPQDKKLVGFDAGHIGFPENQLIGEVSDWLDANMGAVQ